MTLTRRNLLLGGIGCALAACGRAVAPPVGLRYRVQAGDTLASISTRSGVAVYDLIAANGLRSAELTAGQILILPGISQLPPLPSPPQATAETPPAKHPDPGFRLVQREEWGAPAPAANHRAMNGISRLTIHHTDEYPGMAGLADIDVVRQICASHRGYRGWADIGYHFLIGADGVVYEGRSLDLQGAHSGGANNRHNIGVSLIGNFNDQQPPPDQLRTMDLLLNHLQQRFNIPLSELWGHRDFKATDCPGQLVYDWLWNRRNRPT